MNFVKHAQSRLRLDILAFCYVAAAFNVLVRKFRYFYSFRRFSSFQQTSAVEAAFGTVTATAVAMVTKASVWARLVRRIRLMKSVYLESMQILRRCAGIECFYLFVIRNVSNFYIEFISE